MKVNLKENKFSMVHTIGRFASKNIGSEIMAEGIIHLLLRYVASGLCIMGDGLGAEGSEIGIDNRV